MKGAELYKKIAEGMQVKVKYQVGTHRYKRDGETYYRIKITESKFVRGLITVRKEVFADDYKLTDLYNTRAKLVAKAKMDAGLWRVRAEVYAY